MVRDELNIGPNDALPVGRKHYCAIHFRQLAQSCRREFDIELEPAVADGLDLFVVAQDDQSAGAAAQDSFETVPQGGARCQSSDGLA